MPDFNGLEPILQPAAPANNNFPINPASVPQNTPLSLPGTPVADGAGGGSGNGKMDLMEYLSKTSTYADTPKTVTDKELIANKRYGIYNPTVENNEDYHAQGQSGWDRAANSLLSGVSKVGAYITQNAGFIAGAIPALVGGAINLGNEVAGGDGKVVAGGNAISWMSDHILTNIGEMWKEKTQELFPIYKGNQYTNGNIWSKLGTSSWWLDDAMDRVALGISTLVPGMLASKGISLFGAVAGAEGEALNAAGPLAKATQALADNPELYGKLGKAMGSKMFQAAADGTVDLNAAKVLNFKGILSASQKVELYAWNTVGQSALNAKETQTAIRKALSEQKEAGLNNLSNEDIESKAAEGAMKAFSLTVPITLASSFVELPQIFSTAKTTESLLKKFFNPNTLEVLEGASKTVRPSLAKLIGTTLFTGFEHGQNESAQVAISRYLEDSIAGKTVNGKIVKDNRDVFNGVFRDWIDNVNDPNGQNNIALGTIQGIVMSLFGHGKSIVKGEYKAQDAANKNFITNVNNAIAQRRFFTSPEDFVNRDENGKSLTNPDNSPQFNQQRLTDIGMSLIDANNRYNQRALASQNKDTIELERLNFDSLSALAHNFFDDPQGMPYLTNILRFEAKNQKDSTDRVNDTENGTEISPDVQLTRSISHVQNLKRAYDAIDSRHGGFTGLDVDRSDPSQLKQQAEYIRKVKYAQFTTASDQIFLNDKIERNNTELATIGIDKKIETPISPLEHRANEIIDQNAVLNENLEISKGLYKLYTNKDKIKEGFEQEKANALKVQNNINTIKENALKPEEQTNNPAAKSSISLKTKDGDEELQVGTTYYSGGLISAKLGDADVNNVQHFNKFTVVGESADGKDIHVKYDGDPNTRAVNKKAFEETKIGKAEDVEKRNNAKFFIDSTKGTFTYKQKGGRRIEGTLMYDVKSDSLMFASLDGKYKIPVTRDQFSPKQGFDTAQIITNRAFTPQQKSALEAPVTKDELQTKLDNRRTLVDSLVKTSKDSLDSVNKIIEEKTSKLEAINKSLSELQKTAQEKTKKGNAKKVAKEAMRAIVSLSDAKTRISSEIADQQKEKESLEDSIPYFEDLLQNIDELPTSIRMAVTDLKEDISNLKELLENVTDSIKSGEDLIKTLTEAIKTGYSLVKDSINKLIASFKGLYPNLPTTISAYEENLEKFYGPQNVENIKNINSDYVGSLKDLQLEIAELEEGEGISANKEKIEALQSTIEGLQKGFKEISKEMNAKQQILKYFEEKIRQEEEKNEAEKKAQANLNIINKIFNNTAKQTQIVDETNDDAKTVGNFYYEGNKKNVSNIASTTDTSGENGYDEQQESHKRHNYFLNNVDTFPNRSNIRMIMVTHLNEDSVGLKGLVDKALKGFGDKAQPEKAILSLYVEKEGNVTHFIDKNGNRLDKDNLNQDDLVYSTMASESTIDSKGKDRFAEGRSGQLVDKWVDWYKQRRDEWMSSVTPKEYEFKVSNGIPNVYEGGETNAVTTNLISRQQLAQNGIVQISKNGNISIGGKSRKYTPGRVVLTIGQTSTFLNNRNINDEEAENIYKSFLNLASTEPGEKWNTAVVTYLKSILFFGDPNTGKEIKKDDKGNVIIGRNQFWVGQDGNLHVGIKGNTPEGTFPFSVKFLDQNKDLIKGLLKAAYNNVNDSILQKGEPYSEVVGMSNEGLPQVRVWKSYQHYLLSDKYELVSDLDTENLDGKSRGGVDKIPLTNNLFKKDEASLTGPFKQKYSTIIPKEKEIFVPEVKKQEQKPFIAPDKETNITHLNNQKDDLLKEKLRVQMQAEIDALPKEESAPFEVATKAYQPMEGAIKTWFTKTVDNKIKLDNTDEEAGDNVWGIEHNRDKELVAKLNPAIPETEIAKRAHELITPMFNEDNAYKQGDKINIIKPAELSFSNADGNYTLVSKGLIRYGELGPESKNTSIDNTQAIQDIKDKYNDKWVKLTKVETPKKVEAPVKPIVQSQIPITENGIQGFENFNDEDPYANFPALANQESAFAFFDDNFKKYNGFSYSREDIGLMEVYEERGRVVHPYYGRYLAHIVKDKVRELSPIEKTMLMTIKRDMDVKLDEAIKKETIAPTEEKAEISDKMKQYLANRKNTSASNTANKLVTSLDVPRMNEKDWNDFHNHMKANLPQISVSKVDHLISVLGGDKMAWGQYIQNHITLYQNAQKGTEYHEAFEAVWNTFLSVKEQLQILQEFRQREGTFINYKGETTEYSSATALEAKEQIADEYSIYTRDKKAPTPVKGTLNRIIGFIRDLYNAAKAFLTGVPQKGLQEKLFNKINTGGFKSSEGGQFNGSAYSRSQLAGTTVLQTRELMEELSANVAFSLLGDENSNGFFYSLTDPNSKKINVEELYQKVRDASMTNIAEYTEALTEKLKDSPAGEKMFHMRDIRIANEMFNMIADDKFWNEAKALNKEFLASAFKIKMADEVSLDEQETQNKNDYAKNDFLLDTKANSSAAIKLLFNTLVQANKSGKMNAVNELLPEVDKNSFGGSKLLNSSRSFLEVMTKLSNTNTLREMISKLYDLSKNNPDYVRLYVRLKGDLENGGELNYDSLTFNDWRLLMDFNATFSKQAPAPWIISTKANGETYFHNADLNSLVNWQMDNWMSNLRSVVRKGNEFVSKEKVGGLMAYTIKVNSPYIFTGTDKNTQIINDKLNPILNKLGIDLDPKIIGSLNDSDASRMKLAIEDFIRYLNVSKQTRIDKDNIGSQGNLATIADIYIRNSDIEKKSVFYNVENEQQQLYINDNTYSKFSNSFNTAKTLDEFVEQNPQYNDIFAKNSTILKRGGQYFDEAGKKRTDKFGKEVSLSVGYINGVLVNDRGKTRARTIEKINSPAERMLVTINSMINGWKNIIMPSDSATEWMMNFKNHFAMNDILSSMKDQTVGTTLFDQKVADTFGGYLKDEMNLIIQSPSRNSNLFRQKNPNGLRLLDGVMGDSFKKEIYKFLKKNTSEEAISEWVDKNSGKILEDVTKFLDKEGQLLKNVLMKERRLSSYINRKGEEVWSITGLDTKFARDNNFIEISDKSDSEENEDMIMSVTLTDKQLDQFLKFTTSNFVVNSTEVHKLFFGDPNVFKSVIDALKRYKSFASPAKSLSSGKEVNDGFNKLKNFVGGVQLEQGTYGFTNFDDISHTYTLSDFEVVGGPALDGDLRYGGEKDKNGKISLVDRSDAQAWTMPTFYRETQIKAGLWKEELGAEQFFQYDSAMFRQYYATRNEAFSKAYDKNLELQKEDRRIIKEGPGNYKTNVQKPIIRGMKTGVDYVDAALDKTSTFTNWFTFTEEGSHMRELMVKNFEQGMDYTIVLTGRKVGAQELHNFYNQDGTVNQNPISENSKFTIPTTNLSIQQETEFHEGDSVRGTQATKLVSMNMLNAGTPVDFMEKEKDFDKVYDEWNKLTEDQKIEKSPIYREVVNNQHLIDAMTEHGTKMLFKDLSLKDVGDHFVVDNPAKLHDALVSEMNRLDANDNVRNTVGYNEATGEFNIAFEASNNYQRIKSVLLSIVDRNIISQKMNGGAKIQVSSALFDTDKTIHPYRLVNDKWVKVEAFDELSAKEQGEVHLFSDKLKFYRKDENGNTLPMQVILPFSYSEKIRKAGQTDADVLRMLNETEEGKDILRGIGFRIPTQEINSMEVFEVAGFLPRNAGNTIVMPSEITTKAGSDFDVDKLYTYVKNVYVDGRNNLKQIPYKNILKEGKDSKELKDLAVYMIATKYQDMDEKAIENLSEQDFLPEVNDPMDAENLMDSLYRKSLQNAYIDSMKNLLLHERNFDRLVKPNDKNGMDAIRDKLLKAENQGKEDSTSPLLSISAINNQRHLSIQGKALVGIAALAQSNNSTTQRAAVYIDPERIGKTYPEDKDFLGDGQIMLKHNSVTIKGQAYATISKIMDRAGKGGQFISDKLSAYINGAVDVAKDAFLVQLGVTQQTAGTYILLERLGVPTDTVVWFMRQPIITKYLNGLSSKGTTYLYDKGEIEGTLGEFEGGAEAKEINESSLFHNIEKFYSGEELNDVEKAQQRLALTEFLKYSKMANHLREHMQALTWDTANFSDFVLADVKRLLTENVEKHNIFNSPTDVMEKSFVGKLKTNVLTGMKSLEAVLKLRRNVANEQIAKVLEPLINPRTNYLSMKDTLKIGNKVTASFLDYIVQTRVKVGGGDVLNSRISKFLIDSSTGIAQEVERIKSDKRNPLNDNYVFQQITPIMGDHIGEVNNIKINIKANDSFTQNQIINGFRELKEINPQLYKGIVRASILQSGTYKSPISFTDLIPLEDYAALVNPIINNLDTQGDFSSFADKNLFMRNNWQDKTMVPEIPEKVMSKGYAGKKKVWYNQVAIRPANYKGSIAELRKAGIPQFIQLKDTEGNTVNVPNPAMPIMVSTNKRGANSNIITIRKDDITRFTPEQIKEMKQKQDYSYKTSQGYQRVMDDEGKPMVITEETPSGIFTKFIYRPINLYGDGRFLQEYYEDGRKSVAENGTVKINAEYSDEVIRKAFSDQITNEAQVYKESTPDARWEMVGKNVKLRNGVQYGPSAINSTMLEKMGYTPDEIKEINAQIGKNDEISSVLKNKDNGCK